MSDHSRDVATQARQTVVEAAIRARTCHIGSALSIVDILAVLYADVLPTTGVPPARVLLSKGHAASALYATLAAVGVLEREEVLGGYCADGGRLHGHPERGVPGVEMTGGSLGHGPAIAVGFALAEGPHGRPTYCVVGDGELNEGSVWEAAAASAKFRLGNLIAIVDRNRLSVDGPADEIMPMEPLRDKWAAFGWETLVVDGHDLGRLVEVLDVPRGMRQGLPRVVIANTVKGKGVSFMEGVRSWHADLVTPEQYAQILAELAPERSV